MRFCAGCGSPNLDTDADCRVCGRALTEDPTPQPAASAPPSSDQLAATSQLILSDSSAATAVADAPSTPSGWPSDSVVSAEPDRPTIAPSITLPPTGVATPSGFESVPVTHREPNARPADELPSFMRPAARVAAAAPSSESASLISEHDLPDWIRQIAADDARKLVEAQVHDAAAVVATESSMPSHFGRRALPGETLTSGPAASSWLSRKDAVAGAAESAWDVTGAPQPSRPMTVPDVLQAHAVTPSGTLPMATDVVVAETVAAPARRRRRGAADETADGAPSVAQPTSRGGAARGNPRQMYLVAAIVFALVFAVAMTIL